MNSFPVIRYFKASGGLIALPDMVSITLSGNLHHHNPSSFCPDPFCSPAGYFFLVFL
jgi:hypothetical protein